MDDTAHTTRVIIIIIKSAVFYYDAFDVYYVLTKWGFRGRTRFLVNIDGETRTLGLNKRGRTCTRADTIYNHHYPIEDIASDST